MFAVIPQYYEFFIYLKYNGKSTIEQLRRVTFFTSSSFHIVYARLTLYNLTQRTVQKVKIPKKERKYTYQVNFTRACHFIRKFLNKKDGKTPSLENLIVKEILPIRPGRSHKRNVKSKKFIQFNYRFD